MCSGRDSPRLWKIGIKWSASFWGPVGETGGMTLNPSAVPARNHSCMTSGTYQLGRLMAAGRDEAGGDAALHTRLKSTWRRASNDPNDPMP